MNVMNVIPLTAKDFTSDQEVRWCPGCGDYAILKGVRTALAQIGRQPHDVVFISGIGGDGDFLSIGGNHLLHVLRRDVDLNLLLLNNAIYGLTKGQYSPTSPIGTRSPSTPGGSVERPVNAAFFALGAGA